MILHPGPSSLEINASIRSIADADFARLAAHIPVQKLTGRTVLITGATGFFGAWLLSLFDWLACTTSAQVTVYAVSRNPVDFIKRHPCFSNVPWLNWITGDVRDFPFPHTHIDYIIHAATDSSAKAGEDPLHLLDVIVEGTKRVLQCATQGSASRILLVGSGAVYGAQHPNVSHTSESALTAPSPLDPVNAYAEGKRVMELLGAIYAHQNKAAVIVARCFAFVGGGLPLDGHFAIGNFIRDALEKDHITVRGGGTAVRSYLYAADLAVWLFKLLVCGENRKAYNVGSDHAWTIAELAHRVADVLSPRKPIIIEGMDSPNGAHNRYIPSIELARSQCGLDVWTDLDQAIALTSAYRR
jgi:dTDP-glucose 4,6-dehydratase